MKKIIIITAAIVMAGMGLRAQDISTDTLPCGQRQPHFYYSSWYDTAYWYWHPEERMVRRGTVGLGGSLPTSSQDFQVRKGYVRDSIRIRGLWALVSQNANGNPNNPYTPSISYQNTPRVPEYLYLYVYNPKVPINPNDTSRFLLRVATVRWDTASPKMMCFQMIAGDTFPHVYCHVYEALFDTVVTLQGDYWIGGTHYNNQRNYLTFDHSPTAYVTVGNGHGSPYQDLNIDSITSAYGPDGPFGCIVTSVFYGPYGLITDTMPYVELLMDDTAHGYGVSAYYIDSTYQTITAYSKCGYRFSHWNDGDSANPRTIFVTQDTTFTAYFDSVGLFNVSVSSNDTVLGDVTLMKKRDWYHYPDRLIDPRVEDPRYVPVAGNDSSFCEEFEVILRAKAHEGARFRRWSDGSTDITHTLRVTGDSAFVGYFGRLVLYSVTVLSNDEAQGYVTGDSTYYEDDEAVLEAVPLEGHRFVSWNDGVMDNPRRLVVTQDTVFTAIFEPIPVYTVTVRSSNEALGYTTGDSSYYEGDEALLAAVPLGVNRFERWNDGVTDNPRRIIVTQDTAFTALFLTPQGIAQATGEPLFRLLPNPASGSVQCETAGDPFPGGTLTLTDATGRELMRRELEPHTTGLRLDLSALPSGTYFVTLATPQGSSTQKLILK
ncbi:MAG: T9SS type A sorting domain-containing protein [Bacteroidales bacterium]|nr:T9SS type A sorting domain-containing protein [Bacteroidales bacterium]MBR3414168.1 T9SS type A sorting domain-containing protein [Bacteroidales bacterium]